MSILLYISSTFPMCQVLTINEILQKVLLRVRDDDDDDDEAKFKLTI